MFHWLFPTPKACPPPLALDELAAAFHAMRGRPTPRRIVRSLKLSAQFPGDFSPRDWDRLADALDCELPLLEFSTQGGWNFPRQWQTVADLLAQVATAHPEWILPETIVTHDWIRAQIFVGVRDCIVAATGVAREEVYREASFANDLGLD